MRHKYKLKKLSRPTDQRMHILKDGASALIKYGKVKMTVTRAKEVRRVAEKLITLAKAQSVPARREAYKVLRDRTLVKTLFEMAPRFTERAGGYTRLTKIGSRRGDAAPVALIEFTA